MKKCLSIILAFFVLFFNCPPAFCVEKNDSQLIALSDIHSIALSVPSSFTITKDWHDISITKTTPLYDLRNHIVAYCVDIRNNKSNSNAYIIINAYFSDHPILQYAPEAISPYFNTSNKAVYLLAGTYFSEIDGNIKNLITNEIVSKSKLLSDFSSVTWVNTNRMTPSYNDSSPASTLGYDTQEKILTGVPNWQWTRGCTPTAVGMQLANLYPSLNNTNTISLLADAYHTTSSGITYDGFVSSGTKKVIKNKNLGVPSYCDFTKTVCNIPRTGPTHNPYSTYRSEINANRAVVIGCLGASVTTPGYPNGFKDHSITGIGYSYQTAGGSSKYVIVYTTSKNDGKVYIDIESGALGKYAWFIVRK